MVLALTAFFVALCSDRPALIIIDDWQGADDATRKVLVASSRPRPAPGSCCASRDTDFREAKSSEAEVLHLAPFLIGDTVRAIERASGRHRQGLAARIDGVRRQSALPRGALPVTGGLVSR